jgi:SAM-dependent methyltransferase
MSRFIFISPVAFEQWDFRNPDTQGIGGSETAHIELTRRLAAMGHEVISYAPIPDDCPKTHEGVEWRPLDKADYDLPGIWVISRSPDYVQKLKHLGARQTPWLVCQDIDYSHRRGVRAERVNDYAAFDLIFALCPYQLEYLRQKYPELQRRFCLSRNGVRTDLIDRIEAEGGIERDPHKIIHTSSPDRGLMPSLQVFKRMSEYVPDMEFYAAYGFDNMRKRIKAIADKVPEMEKALNAMKGVTWGERQPQLNLYRKFLESSHYLYITDFPESSAISCMEAQCMGAIPVTSSDWALGDHVKWGKVIHGTVEHSFTICQAAMALTEQVMKQLEFPDDMEKYRQDMMKWAREMFSWDRVAEQYHGLATSEPDRSVELLEEEYARPPIIAGRNAFQLLHATGKILNMACGADTAKLKKVKRAFNVDIHKYERGIPLPFDLDLQWDIRDMPVIHHGQYDTIVLGEILEHCYKEDGLKILEEAHRCLKPGGKVVITFPEDYRTAEEQRQIFSDEMYIDNIPYAHRNDPPLTRKELFEWMHRSKYIVRHCDPLNYRDVGINIGWGVVGMAI